ncbi:MAG: SHOCT domain-containing protein [Desulfarculaceae bacterium]|nr:SHOCT domain-containing protein [Desulfarculaceae bacterium]
MRHFMMDGFMGHGWSMGFGWIFWLILIALMVWIAVKLINPDRGACNESDRTALDILKERYAKGEITREEFKQLENDIRR